MFVFSPDTTTPQDLVEQSAALIRKGVPLPIPDACFGDALTKGELGELRKAYSVCVAMQELGACLATAAPEDEIRTGGMARLCDLKAEKGSKRKALLLCVACIEELNNVTRVEFGDIVLTGAHGLGVSIKTMRNRPIAAILRLAEKSGVDSMQNWLKSMVAPAVLDAACKSLVQKPDPLHGGLHALSFLADNLLETHFCKWSRFTDGPSFENATIFQHSLALCDTQHAQPAAFQFVLQRMVATGVVTRQDVADFHRAVLWVRFLMSLTCDYDGQYTGPMRVRLTAEQSPFNEVDFNSKHVAFPTFPGLPRFDTPASLAECILLPIFALACEHALYWQAWFIAEVAHGRYARSDPRTVHMTREYYCPLTDRRLLELSRKFQSAARAWEDVRAALMMGLHPRLGRRSLLRLLDKHLVDLILDHLSRL